MKWRAPNSKFDCITKWRSKFAFFPMRIPKFKLENMEVPAHYVWLERYEVRYNVRGHCGAYWERRPYTDCPSLRKLRYA